jgi:peptide deformylase
MILPNKLKLTKKVLYRSGKSMTFENSGQNLMLAERMIEFMTAHGGIGLAGPQIGISRKVFVMQIDADEYHCFNPEILASSEELITHQEGCLSFPDEFLKIERPKTVVARFWDHEGNEVIRQFEGLGSICYQHELDHCNGIVFHDKAN